MEPIIFQAKFILAAKAHDTALMNQLVDEFAATDGADPAQMDFVKDTVFGQLRLDGDAVTHDLAVDILCRDDIEDIKRFWQTEMQYDIASRANNGAALKEIGKIDLVGLPPKMQYRYLTRKVAYALMIHDYEAVADYVTQIDALGL